MSSEAQDAREFRQLMRESLRTLMAGAAQMETLLESNVRASRLPLPEPELVSVRRIADQYGYENITDEIVEAIDREVHKRYRKRYGREPETGVVFTNKRTAAANYYPEEEHEIIDEMLHRHNHGRGEGAEDGDSDDSGSDDEGSDDDGSDDSDTCDQAAVQLTNRTK
jgi:hypothetical protein